MTEERPFALLRHYWQAPKPDSHYGVFWPDKVFEAMFNARNGWSLGDYWQRCTFDLLRPVFTVFPWRVLRHAQAEQDDARGNVIRLARQQAAEDGDSLDGFAGVVAFVHAWPSDAGASGTNSRLDPGADSFEFFQHEIGHNLGFEHAFGPAGVYDDNYCVMGWTGPFAHSLATPPDLADVVVPAGTQFWRSGRRPAAATLYRHLPAFAASASVVRPKEGQEITLTAPSEARFGEPVLAVMPHAKGELSIEYRCGTGDDVGVPAGLVVHSHGIQTNPAGQKEVRPPWFEAAIPAVAGASQAVHGRDIQVTAVSCDGRTASVRVDRILDWDGVIDPDPTAIPFGDAPEKHFRVKLGRGDNQ